MPYPVYILSGGQSRRFGSDKSRYLTPTGPQLLTLADTLRSAGHSVQIVADRAERYSDWGLTCLVDCQPDSGPLAGLATALEHHRQSLHDSVSPAAGWLILVSCDQTNWQSAWAEELTAQATEQVWAAVYFDTQWQPLPGLYHINLLPIVHERLVARQLSLHALLASLGPRVAKLCTTQPPSHWSFNTPADLKRQAKSQ